MTKVQVKVLKERVRDRFKKRCYIAGPMRNHPKSNFPAFDAAKEKVEKLGYTPISPADIDRVQEGWGEYPPKGSVAASYKVPEFVRRDTLILTEVNAIYMLRGWRKSNGAKAELAVAKWLCLEIIYQPHPLVERIKRWIKKLVKL